MRAIRNEYEKHRDAAAFYRERGAAYRNPHEPQIREVLDETRRRWKLDWSNVLDLAAGSGEVTLWIRESLPAARITAIDPYTAGAYLARTGEICQPISFEKIAEGALADRRFSLIACSFAMHLCAPSRLPAMVMQLAMISPDLLILTPHKRPSLRTDWGWTLIDEFVRRRVRARHYRSIHFAR